MFGVFLGDSGWRYVLSEGESIHVWLKQAALHH